MHKKIYMYEDYCSLLIKLSNTISQKWEINKRFKNKQKNVKKKKIGYK